MENATIRRAAEPAVVKKFFQAIENIRRQRQIANLARIIKYMEREFSLKPKQILELLHKVVTDGLVVETITIGCKGSKAGVEQEGYWIPDKDQVLYEKEEETHDWYCFACHEPGEVTCCTTCPCVYHAACLSVKSSENRTDNGKWICPSCASIADEVKCKDKIELARCLSFVVEQQKDNASELKKRLSDLDPHQAFFIYSYYDLNTLHKECQKGNFSSVEEFRKKVKLIEHNLHILFGAKHKLVKCAEQLVKDCSYELEELKLCKNCFFLSNSKPMNDWFCQPCEPPHQVVWAKQKGFDFWPAKVIQVEDERLDVRFFGKHHPRAWVTIDAVRAISVSPVELKIKRKQHWKQASNEMKEYIRQCECALGKEEASKIILFDSPFGIGKNEKLKEAMLSIGKHPTNGESISDLNFSLNGTKSYSKKDLSEEIKVGDSKSDTEEKSDLMSSSEISTSEISCDVKVNKNSSNNIAEKRCADEVNTSLDLPKSKKAKHEYSFKLNGETQQVNGAMHTDKQTQVNPSDFDGAPCSCKLRYGMILEKFKDYVIESSKLQKGKLIRAAAFKAAFEQKQAEQQTRENVTMQFEEIIAELKATHQREINEAKMKQWCRVCQEEASILCCRSTYYCGLSCKDKDFENHKVVCAVLSDAEDGKNIPELTSPRPRRIIKPKLLDN